MLQALLDLTANSLDAALDSASLKFLNLITNIRNSSGYRIRAYGTCERIVSVLAPNKLLKLIPNSSSSRYSLTDLLEDIIRSSCCARSFITLWCGTWSRCWTPNVVYSVPNLLENVGGVWGCWNSCVTLIGRLRTILAASLPKEALKLSDYIADEVSSITSSGIFTALSASLTSYYICDLIKTCKEKIFKIGWYFMGKYLPLEIKF